MHSQGSLSRADRSGRLLTSTISWVLFRFPICTPTTASLLHFCRSTLYILYSLPALLPLFSNLYLIIPSTIVFAISLITPQSEIYSLLGVKLQDTYTSASASHSESLHLANCRPSHHSTAASRSAPQQGSSGLKSPSSRPRSTSSPKRRADC